MLNLISQFLDSLGNKHPVRNFHIDQIAKNDGELTFLLAPGETFYYIKDHQNKSISHVSEAVDNVMGIKRTAATLDNLNSRVVNLSNQEIKESIINDFATNHCQKTEIFEYKFIYSSKIRKGEERIISIVNQVVPLTLTHEGYMLHSLCINSELTGMPFLNDRRLTLYHRTNGKAVFEIHNRAKRFADLTQKDHDLDISSREKEVVSWLSRGLTAHEVASKLHISYHTVRTHRNNAMKKLSCRNTTELVTTMISLGLILPKKV